MPGTGHHEMQPLQHGDSVATGLGRKTTDYIEKKVKNKNPQTQNVFEKSKSNLKCTLPVLAQKKLVICIICIKFLASPGLFMTIYNDSLQVG